jgi:NAD+ synthase (glutamine-hydrolysing)
MRLRIGAAQTNPTVGDLDANAEAVIATAEAARAHGCDVVVFPELAICGYPPEDLLLKPAFVAQTEEATVRVAAAVRDIVCVVGTVHHDRDLFNAAAICHGGRVAAYYRKCHLPNYGVFDERRYFAAGTDAGPLVRWRGVRFGVTICEDVWVPDGPLVTQARAGAHLSLNINGSPYHRGKLAARRSMLSTRAADAALPLVYVNLVGGQDELVFDGGSMHFDADGDLVAAMPQFRTGLAVWDVDCAEAFRHRLREPRPRDLPAVDLPLVDLDAEAAGDPVADVVPIDTAAPTGPVVRLQSVVDTPPLPNDHQTPVPLLDDCEEVYEALVLGVRDYLTKNGFTDAVVALSGGIDSSLVALVAADAVGPDHVTGIAMPSPFSSEGSVADARTLADNLGVTMHMVPISDTYRSVLDTLAPLFVDVEPDVTEENVQARLRGLLVMAYSNKYGAIVLSTGNKSEVATGYCTLYGDMNGGYAVLKDVPKTLVYALCRWRNDRAGRELVPESVLTKPPSAELRPDQFDSDSLPPYDELDPIVEAYVERDMVASEIVAAGLGPADVVARVVALIDGAEYKRRQSAPGVRITPKAFGRDHRQPVTNRFRDRSG